MAMQYPSVLFILLLLSTPFRAFRLYKNRADALALLEATEGRLYFDSCEQSSNSGSCAFAIDTGYSQEPTQCALTTSEDRPWWRAILEIPAYISKVTVLNIDDTFRSYQDALNNIVIMANHDVCFRYQSEEIFVKRSFSCDVIADEIVIQSNLNSAVLGICDVEVIGAPLNFPTVLKKDSVLSLSTCQQSSVDGSGYCENAFDGDSNSNHQLKPCAVTTTEEAPWIEVNLAKPSFVNEIRVTNRKDCCADGLANINITLNERLCYRYYYGQFMSKSFVCKYFGDKLRISSNQAKAMSVCEIQLLGHEAQINYLDKFMPLDCYKDVPGDNDLTQLVSTTRMSLDKCYRLCKRLGMKYFGVQDGKFCFCGSSFGKHGKGDKKACSVNCDGEKTEVCGGRMHNSVFQILGPGETMQKTIAPAEESADSTTGEAAPKPDAAAMNLPALPPVEINFN